MHFRNWHLYFSGVYWNSFEHSFRTDRNMLIRILASLYFCCGCWTSMVSGELSPNPQSSFQVFAATKMIGTASRNVKTGKTLFECFIQCILDPLCSGITLKNFTDISGRLYHVIECDILHLEANNRFTLSVDSQVTTVVKFSFFQDPLQTRKFSNAWSSNFTVMEVISIPNGQKEEYCFLHCALLGSNCQGLQIEKSCHTNEIIGCQVIEFFTIGKSDRKSDRRSARQKYSGKINFLKSCLQWDLISQQQPLLWSLTP